MMTKSLSPALLLFAAACLPAAAPSPAPIPATTAGSATAVVALPAVSLDEAPRDWHLRDLATDGILGTSAERARRELLGNRAPVRSVVVAVIDGGVDTAHVDLRDVLWRNPREIPGNGRDDDGNGYGWNFIGNAKGENVHHDTFELTRLYAACVANTPVATAPPCDELAPAYRAKKDEVSRTLAQIENIGRMLDGAVRTLKPLVGDSVTRERVQALSPSSAEAGLAANGIEPGMLTEARTAYDGQLRYGLDTAFNPRPLVGDNEADGMERMYGNGDVTGPDAKHGTHVAGIIAAVRGNGVGIDGIADSVRIMAIRAVPDGDERDKDVANAIRYAADNGAHIINMSFGKDYSPQKAWVDDAVKYAESKGVLLVHAAGNDAEDIDVTPNFPSALLGGSNGNAERAQTWLEIGASSWKGGAELAAPFSNVGASRVDVFAPGVDIFSTTPGNQYEQQSGTSMAAPVVSGVAALLMTHFPSLTASDVREILLASTTPLGGAQVQKPGDARGGTVPFRSLSVTGGVVNAYEAVKRAQARAVVQ